MFCCVDFSVIHFESFKNNKQAAKTGKEFTSLFHRVYFMMTCVLLCLIWFWLAASWRLYRLFTQELCLIGSCKLQRNDGKRKRAFYGVCAGWGTSLRWLGHHWRVWVCSGLTHPPSTPKGRRVMGWTVKLRRATPANRTFFFFHSPWQQECFQNSSSQRWVCVWLLLLCYVCEFVRVLVLISSSLRCNEFTSLCLQKSSQDANYLSARENFYRL